MFRIKKSDLQTLLREKRRMMNESSYMKELYASGPSDDSDGDAIRDLHSKVDRIQSVMAATNDSMKGRMGSDTASDICKLCDMCAKECVGIFTELGISDIEKITAVKMIMGEIGNILYECGLMVARHNTSKQEAGFAKNAHNGEEVERDLDMPSKIKGMEKKIQDLSKFINGIEDSFKEINRKVMMKLEELSS